MDETSCSNGGWVGGEERNQERWNEDLRCHYGEWAAIKTDQSKPADSLCRNIETGTEDGVGDEEGGTGKMKERWGLPWWSCG